MMWAHFPTVWDLVESMSGVRNLVNDEDLSKRCMRDGYNDTTTFKVERDTDRDESKSLLKYSFEELRSWPQKEYQLKHAESLKGCFFHACEDNDAETVKFCLEKQPTLA